MALIPSTANVWSFTVIGRADGIITVSPVNVPIVLHQELLAVLRRHERKVVPAIPAGN